MKIDYFMGEAIKEAKKALKNNEVPIGGVLIDNYSQNIISRGHNRINSSFNAINHCEIVIIIKACKKLKTKYLQNTTLFITLEPCIMCSAAISEVHIPTIYFGAYSEKSDGLEKLNYNNNFKGFSPEVYGGIQERQSKKLLKDFFLEQRK